MHIRTPIIAAMAVVLLAAPPRPVFAQPAPVSGTAAGPAATPSLQIELAPDPGNPASPKMGDRLRYQSTIRNIGPAPVQGVVAWLGLVQVDPGLEQPVDLEDWSAHKAITVPLLAPGQSVSTEWPMRLIAAGHYRVVISAAAKTVAHLGRGRIARVGRELDLQRWRGGRAGSCSGGRGWLCEHRPRCCGEQQNCHRSNDWGANVHNASSPNAGADASLRQRTPRCH